MYIGLLTRGSPPSLLLGLVFSGVTTPLYKKNLDFLFFGDAFGRFWESCGGICGRCLGRFLVGFWKDVERLLDGFREGC